MNLIFIGLLLSGVANVVGLILMIRTLSELNKLTDTMLDLAREISPSTHKVIVQGNQFAQKNQQKSPD